MIPTGRPVQEKHHAEKQQQQNQSEEYQNKTDLLLIGRGAPFVRHGGRLGKSNQTAREIYSSQCVRIGATTSAGR